MNGQKKYKIVIADDHPLLTAGLKLMIDEWEEFQVVGTCKNGLEACEMHREYNPDLVILDIYMPEMSGTEAIKMIKCENADTKILALTTFDDDETIKTVVDAGCDGFLLKAIGPDTLKSSLLSILEGFNIFDEVVMKKFLEKKEENSEVQFSQREKDMLVMISEGLTNAEIADKLGLRTGTVKNLVSLLLNKTNTVSRSKLAVYATKNLFV